MKSTLFRPLIPMAQLTLTGSFVKILHWRDCLQGRVMCIYHDGLGGVCSMGGNISAPYSSRPDSRAGQELAKDEHHQQAQFSDGEVSLGEGGLDEVVGD
jgi:hypothetical protein